MQPLCIGDRDHSFGWGFCNSFLFLTSCCKRPIDAWSYSFLSLFHYEELSPLHEELYTYPNKEFALNYFSFKK